jgi:Na+-translocating ferredoxin:NAD+ oxidoreductase RnfC subunit
MRSPLKTANDVPVLTPDELEERLKRPGVVGNKEAFLRAAYGVMSEAEAASLLKLIEDGCERLDE